MIKRLLLFGMAICCSFLTYSQERVCATDEVHERLLQQNPDYARRQAEIEQLTQRFAENSESFRVSGSNIVIPCIIHVVYGNSQENISDAQIQSQIDRLNKDYSATNSDYDNTPSEFQSVRSGDTQIRFEIIEIKRYANSRDTWGTNDAVKAAYPPIEPDRILNMWVADIGGGILGYAQFPGGDPATDGVVMSPQYFGDASVAGGSNFYLSAPFDQGRTATHEVGHWLNLRHIWGDGNCSADDFVSDTPVAGNPNYGCPSPGTNSCSGGQDDMFMNYMDYVDDACMFMFSAGQDARMQATFSNGGGREGFLLDPVYTPGNPGGGFSCTGTVSNYPYNESFESGLGNWSQGSGDNIDWTRNSSGTPSSSTGPSSANDGSYYMYVEASDPNYPSKSAHLAGPCFDLTTETSATFSFDYHMYGSAMGSLEVQALIDGGSWTTIWSKSGNQGNSWLSANVDMAGYLGETVKIRFVGTTGSSYTSDIAVDKISLSTGSTGGGESCSSTVTLGYGEGFESGLGSWSQVSGDDFDWTVNSSGTPSSNTGPSGAFAGSYYAYMESSSPNYSFKRAELAGPCFDLTSETSAAFSFRYHMYGATTMGDLELHATTDGTNWSTIWSKSGNQGNSWNEASIDLSAYLGGTVKLKFVGTTGDTWQGDMAIDALSLGTGGSTGGGTTTATLSITLDNYPEETSWEILSGSTVIASGGTYGSQPDGSTVTQDIILDDGCYDFVIYDAYGDGICCSYGNGSYSLTADGVTLASGGSFASSETTNFCVGSGARTSKVSVTRTGERPEGYSVYPIPAKDYLNIHIGKMESAQFRIMNTTGQVWKEGVLSNKYNEINVSDLDAGLYIIRVTDGDNVLVNRVVIQ
ncbi:choice-of-anchor J domain-containing protein [Mangrovivirga sp. M17]|uniref:Choice-of-anchor J domain-containing protein n=1 Tax=Mangrovivirga halotolerans TaxID=2993936 RepID=A0ABT3RRB2_9BACT|nr:choice-of-anchor J domain-containing protein [Mangrovivirga halotolerans]MCX2743725.1 choice-of-anchor J domain-containing protein [Mangrovivirga halotolerans]